MPQEFKVKNGLIVDQGGATITGSVIATGGFTGSLQGTSSWATNVVSASGVNTSIQYNNNGALVGSSRFTFNGTNVQFNGTGGGVMGITGSLSVSGSSTITGSLVVSGSSYGIDTTSGTLLGNGIIKVDWRDGVLNTSAGSTSVDWENTTLYDAGGVGSLAWGARTLYDSTGANIMLDYSGDYTIYSNFYYSNFLATTLQEYLADNSFYTGQIIEANLDASVATFNLVYLHTDGIWYPTKNDIAQRATKMQGICVSAGKSQVLIEGDVGVSDDNSQGAYVVSASYGLPVYISPTQGEMTTTQPVSGFIRVVGHIYSQSTTDANLWTMKFRPSNDWT